MKKYVFGIAVVVAVVMVGWEILEPEITNIVFQDELHDVAAQAGMRIGLPVPTSDEEIRNAVMRRGTQEDAAALYLAVDYTVPVKLPGYSFTLHFTPTSTGGRF